MKKKKPVSIPEEDYPVEDELPEGWKSVVLEDHIYIAARIGWRGLKREEYTKEGPLFLAVKDIQENGFIDFQNVTDHLSEYRYDESPEIQLKEEDIIITKDGTIGKIGYVKKLPGKVTVNSSLLVVRPSSEILPRFLFFYFRSSNFQKIVRERITGSAVPHLFQKDIKKFRILVPPLTEQQHIVARIEALLTQVNAARDRLSRVPLIMKKFRQAVLTAACSGKLTEGWRKGNPDIQPSNLLIQKIIKSRNQRFEQKENKRNTTSLATEIFQEFDSDGFPELPPNWCWVVWNDLADWITYGFTRPMPHFSEGVPIVTAKNIHNGKIDFSSLDYTSFEAFSELSNKDRPIKGEILVTKDGSIGRAAIVETEVPFCINQSVAVIRFGGESAFIPYLKYVIECKFTQDLIEESAKGTAIRHISVTSFGKFPVPLPPLAEQHEIVRRVGLLFERADAIDREVAAAGSRCERLTQAVLARAFSGKLS